MNGQTVTMLIAAILSSSVLTAFVNWWRDRNKIRNDTASSIVTAASGAVATLERAIVRLESELEETRRELEESIEQNRQLLFEVGRLREELEQMKQGREGRQ